MIERKVTHKLREYIDENSSRLNMLHDTMDLDGNGASGHLYLDVEKLLRTFMQEDVENYYRGDYFKRMRQKFFDHEVTFHARSLINFSLMGQTITLTAEPEKDYIQRTTMNLLELHAGKPTEASTHVSLKYPCFWDETRPNGELVDKIVANLMSNTFRYCFRVGKLIVPDGISWEKFQTEKSNNNRPKHSTQLKRELMKKKKETFREIFKSFITELPVLPYKRNITRMRYQMISSKADIRWQSNKLIKEIGDAKLKNMTRKEMCEVCETFCMAMVDRMKINVRFISVKEASDD